MAYIPPNTFAATAAISAPDLQENVDVMRNYVDGNMVAGDIATDGWVKPEHIMRGHYNPIVNMHSFATGLVGGKLATNDEYSFIGNGYTDRGGPTDPDAANYPGTTVDFYLASPADVMIQFSAYPTTPSMPTVNFNYASRLFIHLDENKQRGTRCWTTHFPSAAAADLRRISHYQSTWSGFYIEKNVPAGQHSITLRGFTRARYSFLTKWSVSLEAFYR